MNNLAVSKKVIFSFAVVLIIFLGFGAFGMYVSNQMRMATVRLSDWNEILGCASKLNDTAGNTRNAATMWILSSNPEDAAKYNQQRLDGRQKVEEALQNYQQKIDSTHFVTEEQHQLAQNLLADDRAKWQAYLDAVKDEPALVARGDREGAIAVLHGTGGQAFEAFSNSVQLDEQNARQRADVQMAASSATFAFTLKVITVVLLVATLLCFASAFNLYRVITVSVKNTLEALQRVSKGDFRQPMVISGRDEFSEMAAAYNVMLDNVRKISIKVQNAAKSVTDSSEALTATAEQSAEATQSIAQSITDVAGEAQSQMKSLADSKGHVDRFNHSIEEATNLVKGVVDEIDNTAKQATEGNKLVQTTIEQMNDIADTVEDTSQVVAKLGERSKEIGNIVEVISGISAQTNLLSLNAAIEAARAGEHGRGFAVVAEEVRKLAEDSQQSTEQIANLISSIQNETSKAVTAMEAGRDKAEKGRENVTTSGKGFEQILNMITKVRENSQSIQKTMDDLNSRAGMIAQSTAKIHEAAERVASSAENVSASTEEQAAGMQQIAASSRGLLGMAKDLSESAAQFRT